MADSQLQAELANLQRSQDKTAYSDLLDHITTSSTPDTLSVNLVAYLEVVLSDALGIILSRPLLVDFIEQFRKIPSPEVKIAVGRRALSLIQPRVISFEEQDAQIKFILADAFEASDEYIESAKLLQQINLDASQRNVTADDKARVWIRIVRCYLEENEPISAMGYINRIKQVLADVTEVPTRLQYQLSNARIQDSQRQFLDASSAYYQVSTEPVIDEEERLRMLSQAIVCAVLAPAGPQRARILARLYKDERATQVAEYGILEKIFLDRLLTPEETKAFAGKLKEHHLAKTSDGSTVLDKAVLEHNLLGASRLYANISFEALGDLLGADPDRAELYAAQMIGEDRIAGHIDQVERYIFFEGEGSGQRKTGTSNRAVGIEIRRWDEGVKGLAEEVERIATTMQTRHPDFYSQQMAF